MGEIFGSKKENVDYSVRKGVYAIILNDSKDKVLAVRTPNAYHFLPGGGIENNESNKECLKREMLEETGYKVAIGSFIGRAMCYFQSTKNEHLLSDGYFYEATLLEKVQEPIEDNHQVQWIGVENIEESFIHEHHIWAIKKGLDSIFA